MIQFWWVPVLIITSAISSWMSLRTNDVVWYWSAWAFGALVQLWPLVSKLSNNIVRDAIIFDCILVVAFGFFIAHFKGQQLTLTNWIGFAVIVLGIVIFSR